MDVGIMPLEDTELARGKCSFKMLQYMASGVPCIVSPVGMNAEIMAQAEVGFAARNSEDWIDALQAYLDDPALRFTHGLAGRSLVLRRYDLPVVNETIARVLRSVA
jgi:glycosyltransferase involved in cell wall biosynthesis